MLSSRMLTLLYLVSAPQLSLSAPKTGTSHLHVVSFFVVFAAPCPHAPHQPCRPHLILCCLLHLLAHRRHHTNPVGRSWRWAMDPADDIVARAVSIQACPRSLLTNLLEHRQPMCDNSTTSAALHNSLHCLICCNRLHQPCGLLLALGHGPCR